MATAKPITIVGGGLAGLTLGIGLRRHDLPVTIWEAGHYPRHRVCGEFISGRGHETLVRLGLRTLLTDAGAILGRTVGFSSATVAGRVWELPQPALCLPRCRTDSLLAGRFRELGGELREGGRWRDPANLDGVVVASGRRAQPVVDGWQWFGLKAHARNVNTHADLEMHVSGAGYVGLCRQPGGIVNVCGLFRRQPASGDAAGDWQDRLRGAPGSLLRERMSNATFVADSFCAVAGISLKPQAARHQAECCIGDALTMIPPLTGNGMSMAFESAEMAVTPLVAYSRGETGWQQARQAIARACDAAFARRLSWAKWLQQLILLPATQDTFVSLASRHEWFWRLLFTKTR
jgi:flavin-dependent dehydrogenase